MGWTLELGCDQDKPVCMECGWYRRETLSTLLCIALLCLQLLQTTIHTLLPVTEASIRDVSFLPLSIS